MTPRIARFLAILLVVLCAAALPAAAADSSETVLRRAPVSGARASSADWWGLRLWALGEGFSVGRRSAGYGVQGGAALPLAERVGLTASYRVTGFSLGDRLGAQLGDVEQRSLAPILWIDIEF